MIKRSKSVSNSRVFFLEKWGPVLLALICLIVWVCCQTVLLVSKDFLTCSVDMAAIFASFSATVMTFLLSQGVAVSVIRLQKYKVTHKNLVGYALQVIQLSLLLVLTSFACIFVFQENTPDSNAAKVPRVLEGIWVTVLVWTLGAVYRLGDCLHILLTGAPIPEPAAPSPTGPVATLSPPEDEDVFDD